MTNLVDTLKNTEPFTKDLIKVLNDILNENNIYFEGKEKDDFLEFIKPAILDLTKATLLRVAIKEGSLKDKEKVALINLSKRNYYERHNTHLQFQCLKNT